MVIERLYEQNENYTCTQAPRRDTEREIAYLNELCAQLASEGVVGLGQVCCAHHREQRRALKRE